MNIKNNSYLCSIGTKIYLWNNMIGIYKIQSKTSNNCYIGSSINIKKRWDRHLYDLRRNKHHSIILQRAWDKYGEKDFEFSILEECTEHNLLIREQHYLDSLLPMYNICSFAGNSLGVKDTEETKKKKRQAALNLNLKPPIPPKKPVKAISDKGDILCFDSLVSACEYLGKSKDFVSSISRAIRKNIRAYGYKWQYT